MPQKKTKKAGPTKKQPAATPQPEPTPPRYDAYPIQTDRPGEEDFLHRTAASRRT